MYVYMLRASRVVRLLTPFCLQMACCATSCWASSRKQASLKDGALAVRVLDACGTLCACFADAPPADGLNAATEWRDIVQEAAKGMIILVLLETLMITRDSSWLEVRPS